MEEKPQSKHHLMFFELSQNYGCFRGMREIGKGRMGVATSKHMNWTHENVLASSLTIYNLPQSVQVFFWVVGRLMESKEFFYRKISVEVLVMYFNSLWAHIFSWVLKLARMGWWMKSQSRVLIFYNVSNKN